MIGNYILFSGGYDSSYLINQTLLEIEEDERYDNEVNLLSIDATFLSKKSSREASARQKLLNYWRAKYYRIQINYNELKIDCDNFSVNVVKSGLTQPNFWISALLTNIDYSKYNEINLLFSYICGDQAVAYKGEIESICRASYNLANIDGGTDNVFHKLHRPKMNIMFPLATILKDKILTKMIEKDVFIFENSTTCENYEESDFCGKCDPCIHLKNALMNILDSNASDYVKDICRKKLQQFNYSNVVESADIISPKLITCNESTIKSFEQEADELVAEVLAENGPITEPFYMSRL